VKHAKAHHPQAQPETGAASAAEIPSGGPEPVLAKLEHNHLDLEKSVSVLSKLKEMEFHSRANIETLAKLTLTIEDELKQKEFSNGLGEVYSAQDSFHTKLGALIQSYEAKCESLKPSA
jgi:histidinol phosphatase-like enzyme